MRSHRRTVESPPADRSCSTDDGLSATTVASERPPYEGFWRFPRGSARADGWTVMPRASRGHGSWNPWALRLQADADRGQLFTLRRRGRNKRRTERQLTDLAVGFFCL